VPLHNELSVAICDCFFPEIASLDQQFNFLLLERLDGRILRLLGDSLNQKPPGLPV
jgi:hypothetical protein